MNATGWRALVTGGLGFIGSNLARRLSEAGADVTVVDSCVAGCGANPYNLSGVPVRVLRHDIGQPQNFRDTIENADVIFNLAGEVSHLDSMLRPERDLELNAATQLRFLDACTRWRRGVRIVYASTRQVYGVPQYLPVDERHPINPVDFNGVHKYAATQYHQMLTRTGDLDAIVLRLTNVFGPRMSLLAKNQGFLGVFTRKVLLGETLKVFGDGSQLRDPLYIDDCVEAFVKAAEIPKGTDRTFNIGAPEHLDLGQIAVAVSRIAGVPEPGCIPFPPDLKAIDIGSYFTDYRLFANATGWRPRVTFEDGFRRTVDFFRRNREHYLPVCS